MPSREFLDPEVMWHGGDPSESSACQNREQALGAIGQAGSRGGVGELVDVLGAGEKVVIIMDAVSEDEVLVGATRSSVRGLVALRARWGDGGPGKPSTQSARDWRRRCRASRWGAALGCW